MKALVAWAVKALAEGAPCVPSEAGPASTRMCLPASLPSGRTLVAPNGAVPRTAPSSPLPCEVGCQVSRQGGRRRHPLQSHRVARRWVRGLSREAACCLSTCTCMALRGLQPAQPRRRAAHGLGLRHPRLLANGRRSRSAPWLHSRRHRPGRRPSRRWFGHCQPSRLPRHPRQHLPRGQWGLHCSAHCLLSPLSV